MVAGQRPKFLLLIFIDLILALEGHDTGHVPDLAFPETYQRSLQCDHYTEFRCMSGDKCIPVQQHCDRTQDCADNSDEMYCGKICDSLMFECQNGQCIHKLFLCDGENDCGDWSDEAFCPVPAGSGSHGNQKSNTVRPVICEPTHFFCDLTCVPNKWKCDGIEDCLSGADENDCGQRNLTKGAEQPQAERSGNFTSQTYTQATTPNPSTQTPSSEVIQVPAKAKIATQGKKTLPPKKDVVRNTTLKNQKPAKKDVKASEKSKSPLNPQALKKQAKPPAKTKKPVVRTTKAPKAAAAVLKKVTPKKQPKATTTKSLKNGLTKKPVIPKTKKVEIL